MVVTPDKNSEKIATLLSLATLEERTERTVASSKITPNKEKSKTRATNTALPLFTEVPRSRGTSTEDTPISTYTVSKRDARVFSMLFRIFHEDTAPGEVPWADFLHAMSSLGFAIQKLDGSAWLFSPALEPLSRSIIFHEPHPASKIRSVWLDGMEVDCYEHLGGVRRRLLEREGTVSDPWDLQMRKKARIDENLD